MTERSNELLNALSARGIRILTENKQVRLRAPSGTVLPEDLKKVHNLREEIIDLLKREQSIVYIPLQPRAAGTAVPLAGLQRHAWNYFKESGRLSWRMCATLDRVRGVLKTNLLESCIETLVQRHESLRTRIVTEKDTPSQQIDLPCESTLETIDLSHVRTSDRDERARCCADDFIQEKIDLSVGPLFAAKLLKLSRSEHVLVLAADHMISDGESAATLRRELWTLYQQAERGLPFSLPIQSLQFADYAVWQQQTYDTWRKEHEAYWKRHLSDAPHVQLPVQKRSTMVHGPAGSRLIVPFGEILSGQLRDVAKRERVLLAMVVLTVYVAVLSRWCDQRDMVLTFVLNGRNRPELVNMIGFLVEHLHLRIDISSEDCLLDVLHRINLEFLAACDHRDFNRVPDIVPECKTDIYFNWISQNLPVQFMETNDKHIEVEPFPFVRKALPFTFGSFFADSPHGITWGVEYQQDLFSESTIEWFGHHLMLFSAELAQHPRARVASIPMEL
jgi:Condensation domain/TubC N-terminal docking domain